MSVMCGRFAVTTDPARLAERIDAVDETTGALSPDYNIAPSAQIATVVRADERRRIRRMRWGLTPPWAKPGARPLINARAETAATSPAFRAAARRRRCLVPMDGYYEWKPPDPAESRGRKTPYYFFRADGTPLLVAGLWEPGESPSVTVITTDAAGEFAAVHDRMPLVLAERDWDRWLDPDAPAPADLLAGPPDTAAMAMRRVSTLVNRVANNGPELIAPEPGYHRVDQREELP